MNEKYMLYVIPLPTPSPIQYNLIDIGAEQWLLYMYVIVIFIFELL
jgi:hypothetical protein